MTTTLRETESVCSTCLVRIPARTVERDGRVYLEKTCATHGHEEVLVSSDARFHRSPQGSAHCASGCSGLLNHSCTLIFEITERCNLSCPTCFAGSSPLHGWHMSLAEFEGRLDRLLA